MKLTVHPDSNPPRGFSAPAGHPLLVVAASFAVGICLDRFGPAAASLEYATGWWMLAILFLAGWWIARPYQRLSLTRHVPAVLLCGGIAAAGAAWHHASWSLFRADDVGRYASSPPAPTCIEGVALESPRRLPPISPSPYRAIPVGERSLVRVELTGIRAGREWRVASGQTRLRVGEQLLGVRAGDRLRIFAQIAAPRRPQNPGEFDCGRHARAERRLAEFRCRFAECVEITDRGAWYQPRRWFDGIQSRWNELLQRQLGASNGPVAAALLLGIREGIAREELETFQETGTIHVLVVSGLHVGILAGVAYALFGCVVSTRSRALIATGCVVVIFALVTGGRPSVLRAAVCTLAVLAALGSGRRLVIFNVLAGAALVVLILNPCDVFRVGPQLSFLAAATLVRYGQWVYRRRKEESPLEPLIRAARPLWQRLLIDAARWLAHAVAVGTCLWLVGLPLIMANFHRVTPIAAVLAPFICVLAWLCLSSGFALLAVSGLAPWAAAPFATACGALISVLRYLIDYAESLPAAHFSVAGPPAWWTLGVYGGTAGVLLAGRRIPPRWRLALLSLWIATGLGAATLRGTDDAEMRYTFLSLGHGTCVVLQLPDGGTVLYDAGSLASPEIAASAISSFLWSEGIMRIDGLILSHADVDHFNAVPALLDHFAVEAVFVSPVMFDPIHHPDEASAPRQLERELAAADVPVRTVYGGDRLRLGGGITADVLHPPEDGLIASDNANSIVLAVEYAGRRMLLTGDLETPGMDDVLAEIPYDVDVLLAPHHGSRFSDPPGLAQWCTPEWVVISGGQAADTVDASRTYKAAGATVLHTAETGAVRLSLTGGRCTAEHWTGHSWTAVPGR